MNQPHPTVLIVDDERRMCRSLEILLQEEGPFNTLLATDYYEALEKCKKPVDLVLTDLTMPGKDGIELLRAIRRESPSVPVILMTAYSTVESAVTAMKEGASDYIVKPFENEDLLQLIRKALGQSPFHGDHRSLEMARGRFGDLIGNSPRMKEVYYRIQRASEADSTVLITGESGTGKELVARAIHYSGHRKAKPFIVVNCAAVPENLLESELFGHEKGAFSGAIRQKEGKFELASCGTLFLDEIGEMAPFLQVKFLRGIAEKSFERVGGTQTITVDVRIIAATNRDLGAAVKNGQFREDLFYRIHVLTVDVPPLRERMEDLPILIAHFLKEKSRKLGIAAKSLSKNAHDWLLGYSYPGNVRELENIIERAVVISRASVVEMRDLPVSTESSPSSLQDFQLPLENGLEVLEQVRGNLEREVIERAIRLYPNKSNTELAELLGTSRRVLETRLKLYNLGKL